jgi:hypothetical protein
MTHAHLIERTSLDDPLTFVVTDLLKVDHLECRPRAAHCTLIDGQLTVRSAQGKQTTEATNGRDPVALARQIMREHEYLDRAAAQVFVQALYDPESDL